MRATSSTSRGATGDPLRDASEIVERIAFFNERVDLFVDGDAAGPPDHPVVDHLP